MDRLDLSLVKAGNTAIMRDGSRWKFGPNTHILDYDTALPIRDGSLAWSLSGYYLPLGKPHPKDIISIEAAPEPLTVVGYVNVYLGGVITAHRTEEGAHIMYSPARIDCLKITWRVGHKPEVESVL